MASSTTAFKTRQAYKAAKELEEARKAGTAPPAIDADGKIINPHIPDYISQAPWYVAEEGPSLKHQRNHNENKRNYDGLGKWMSRGEFAGPAAKKYRKGACENCGAMTHTTKACLERPRLRGAKHTGTDIRPDEVIDKVNLDFEGKRDRWNGYQVEAFERVHDRFVKLEAARKTVKADRLDSAIRNGAGAAENSDEDDNHYAEGAVVQETGDASKTAVRNLRIREDTAKYLYNLDPNSAYYDPKSRAMRADPRPDINSEDKDFAGDNFVRCTGDVSKLAKMELHTMRANELGRRLPHLQAEPSRAEAVFKEVESTKKSTEEKRKTKILEKYGGQEYSRVEPALSDVKQSEAFVEYSSEGKVISQGEQAVPASKYAEDVLEKNHTTIWGSYFIDGKWGYDCCYQTQRYAVCTGEDGKRAAVETSKDMEKRMAVALSKRDSEPLVEQWKKMEKEKEENVGKEKDPEAQRKARIELERKLRKGESSKEKERVDVGDEEDEPVQFQSKFGFKDNAASEAAMEKYRLKRQLRDDPMAQFLSDKPTK